MNLPVARSESMVLDASHREELRLLNDAMNGQELNKSIHLYNDEGEVVSKYVEGGILIMDRSEHANELAAILTVSTLMLGVVFSLMCAVNRDEITAAVEEDRAQCLTRTCTLTPSYDSFIYLSGSICAEICGGCMIMVTFIQFSFNLLNVESGDVVGGSVQCHAYRSVVQFIYGLLFLAFVLGAYCGINVVFVKIRVFNLQVWVLNISYAFWTIIILMMMYVSLRHFVVKNMLKKLQLLRKME